MASPTSRTLVGRQRGVQPLVRTELEPQVTRAVSPFVERQRRARRLALTEADITGETVIERCRREARQAVARTGLRHVPVEYYGTLNHEARRRYDLAVQREFHRLLVEAGEKVEGL